MGHCYYDGVSEQGGRHSVLLSLLVESADLHINS